MRADLTTANRVLAHDREPVKPAPTHSLRPALLAALAYADLFDFPLTLAELVRYQAVTSFDYQTVRQFVISDLAFKALTTEHEGYFALRGRETIFQLRAERTRASLRLWARARVYSSLLARLPFVRMVAVTGALSVDNIGETPDIDVLIVASAGRVWICRRFIILLVRLARLAGDDLCPNYVLSDANLELDQRDFFTAHELAQMVLSWGAHVYNQMVNSNSWALDFLPRAFTADAPLGQTDHPGPVRRWVEWVLSRRPLDTWERLELRRMRSKLRGRLGADAEVVCSPEQCKGHTALHRTLALSRLGTRLRELEVEAPWPDLLTQEWGP